MVVALNDETLLKTVVQVGICENKITQPAVYQMLKNNNWAAVGITIQVLQSWRHSKQSWKGIH